MRINDNKRVYLLLIFLTISFIIGMYTNMKASAQTLTDFQNNSDSDVQLSSIINTANDNKGNQVQQAWVTLFDSDGEVIDTTDPQRKISDKYKTKLEGGQGQTVDQSANIRVYMRLGSIMHNGAYGEGTGVQDGTVYKMALPSELDPQETDKSGKTVLNPTEPIKFFQYGAISAYGGIYTNEKDKSNELRIAFANADGQVDISGDFQYIATVSKNVKQGEHLSLNFAIGGLVGFDVTPKKDDSDSKHHDAILSIKGSHVTDGGQNDKILWSTDLTAATDSSLTDYSNIDVTIKDGAGFVIPANDFSSLIKKDTDNYGLSNAITVSMLNANDEITLTPNIDEQNNILYANKDNTISIQLSFLRSDQSDDVLKIDGGQAYTPIAHLTILKGSNLIQKINAYIVCEIYDDYNHTDDTTYSASANATGQNSNISSSNEITIDYGAPSSNTNIVRISKHSTKATGSYDTINCFAPEDNSNYIGNAYHLTIAPDSQQSNLLYYMSTGSCGTFKSYNDENNHTQYSCSKIPQLSLGKDPLSLYNTITKNNYYSEDASFAGFKIGDNYEWNFVGVFNSESILNHSLNLEGASNNVDTKFRYQLNSLMKDSSYPFLIYQSKNKVNGKIIYVIIDSETLKQSQQNEQFNIHEMQSFGTSNNESARPSSIGMYIFNAGNLIPQWLASMKLGGFIKNSCDGQKMDGMNNDDYDSSNANYTYLSSYSVGSLTNTDIAHGDSNNPYFTTSMMHCVWINSDTVMWQVTINRGDLGIGLYPAMLHVALPEGINYINQYDDNHNLTLPNGQNIKLSHAYIYDYESQQFVQEGSAQYDNPKYSLYNYQYNQSTLNDQSKFGNVTSSYYYKNYYYSIPDYHDENLCYSQNDKYGSDSNWIDGNTFIMNVFFFTKIDIKTIKENTSNHASVKTEFSIANEQLNDNNRFDLNNGLYTYRFQSETNLVTSKISNKELISQKISINSDKKTCINSSYSLDSINFSNQATDFHGGPFLAPSSHKGYCGILTINDTMLNDSSDKIAAKNTHVIRCFDEHNQTSITITPVNYKLNLPPIIAGPSWYKSIDNGKTWERISDKVTWDAYHPAIYKYTGGPDELSIIVRYSGNLLDPAPGSNYPLEINMLLSGGHRYISSYYGSLSFSKISSIQYDTEFNVTDYVTDKQAEVNKNQYTNQQVVLTNQATTNGMDVLDNKNSSVSTKMNLVAALSITKENNGVNINRATGGNSCDYSISVQNGISDTPYINIEDHYSSLTEKTSTESNATVLANYTENTSSDNKNDNESAKALAALAGCSEVRNVRIVKTNPLNTNDKPETIYENGRFKDGWTSSSITFAPSNNKHSGALFSCNIKRDNNGKINPEEVFTIKYNLSLDMDGDCKNKHVPYYDHRKSNDQAHYNERCVADTEYKNGFRSTEFYKGGFLDIDNSATAEREYNSVSSDNSQSDQQSINGEIDIKNHLLRVWPEQDSEATNWLLDPKLYKTPIQQFDTNGHSTWMFSHYAGSNKKDKQTINDSDTLTYKLDDMLVSRTDLTNNEKTELKTQLTEILAKHTTISNIKIYDSELCDTDNKQPVSENGYVLPPNSKLVWSSKNELTSPIDETVISVTTQHDVKGIESQHELKITPTQGGTQLNHETGETLYCAPGFNISYSNIDFRHFLSVIYDFDVDFDGFIKDAQKIGFINDAGVDAQSHSVEFGVDNDVHDNRDSIGDKKEGKIAVQSASINKKVISDDKENGTAEWSVTAQTGTIAPSSIVVKDTADFVSDNDTLKQVIAKATRIENLAIMLDGKTIYQDGTITSDGFAAKFDASTISITNENNSISVNIHASKNGVSPISKEQTYILKYKTVLNKDTLALESAKSGIDISNISYSINNTANLMIGQSNMSASASADFNPNIPITANKKTIGNPSNGADTQTVEFNASASTGSADRTNFVIQDIAIPDSNKDAITASASISNWIVTITAEDGTKSTYSLNDVISGKIQEASLKISNSDIPGQISWKLVFNRIDKNTNVQIDYCISVNRKSFIAANGTLGRAINFNNELTVTAGDGNKATSSSEGSVSINPDLLKNGVISSTKAANGNQIVNWTIDGNLIAAFGTGGINKLTTANITDTLNPKLKVDISTVNVYDLVTTVNGTKQANTLSLDSDYKVSLDNNALTVSIVNPSKHPNVRVAFSTEVAGSDDALSNSATLTANGQVINETKISIDKPLIAVTQYGDITSANAPIWIPNVVKKVDNAKPDESLAGRFNFSIKEVDSSGNDIQNGFSSTASNDKDGNISFGTIQYRDVPIERAHYYKIKEITQNDNLFVCDSTEYIVKIDVKKNSDGTYATKQTIMQSDGRDTNDSTINFNNKTKHATFTINKIWNDNDNYDGSRPDSINVSLFNGDKQIMDVQTLNEKNKWTYTWNNIPADSNNLHVVETNVDGYTTDYTNATKQISQDGTHITWSQTITNKHTPKASGSIELKGNKCLKGRNFKAGDTFEFHISASADDNSLTVPLPDGVDSKGNISISPNSGNQFDFSFGTIHVSNDFVNKTLSYQISEINHDAHGIKYDNSVKTVKVAITHKDHSPKLELSKTGDDIIFNNSFTPDAIKDSISLSKQLIGRQWTDKDKFEINVQPQSTKTISSDEAKKAMPDCTYLAFTKPDSGAISNLNINGFSFAKVGEYRYRINEKIPQNTNGIAYDTHALIVTFNVMQDDSSGNLIASHRIKAEDSGNDDDTFINSYSSVGSFSGLSVTKKLTGRNWKDTDKFSFALSAFDDATQSAIDNRIITLSNTSVSITKSNQTASFGKIEINKAGTYKFKIQEQAHGISGVDISEPANIALIAKDNGNGTITASIAEGSSNIVFTDIYGKNSKVSIPIIGKKIVSHDGYEKIQDITGKYDFTIEPVDNAPMRISSTMAKNDKDGKIDFGSLTFNMDDIQDGTVESDGTRTKIFAYNVIEKGNVQGITNDSAKKLVTIKLIDDGKGILTATMISTLTFVNIFKASANASVDFEKVIQNAEDNFNGKFIFDIKPTDDNTSKSIDNGYVVIDSNAATVQRSGKFSFGEFVFNRPGKYSFTVDERKDDNMSNWTFDTRKCVIEFTVNETGTDKMNVQTKIDGDTTFTNVYTPESTTPTPININNIPTVVNNALVQTGHSYISVAVFSIVSLIIIAYIYKRKIK